MPALRAAALLGCLWRSAAAGLAATGDHTRHPFPTRGIDVNRSGYSPHFKAPFPLPAKPAWVHEVPLLNRHQTPAIDDELNTYAGSDNGLLLSLDRIGRYRWAVQTGRSIAQNPMLFGDTLYTNNGEGFAMALEKDTGRLIWKTRIAESIGPDNNAPTAFDDFVLFQGQTVTPYGTTELICLNRLNGTLRWKYDISHTFSSPPVPFDVTMPVHSMLNMIPCFWNGSVIFSDVSGALHRLSVLDGREIWHVPGDNPDTYTLGGQCCGPNGKAFVGYNAVGGYRNGVVKAVDLRTGREVWRRSYLQGIHANPAVGYVGGTLAMVIGVGNPSGMPEIPDKYLPWGAYLQRKAGWGPRYSWAGQVVALDAETGRSLWSFAPPPWTEAACAGSTFEQVCLPDLWSSPTIDAAGTVWINWSAGGVLYGLRDADGDGTVALHDPAETTSYDCGSAATGPPAVADSMIFVATCRRLLAFVG